MNELSDELAGSPDEAKVFLSYSRRDRERAQGIADALRSRHFGVFRDTDDIFPTEEWKERLQQLIEEADTIVFLLSPHSAISEVCAWEVEYAHSLNKRIAPIVIEETEATDIPSLLTQLNFIFCTPRDPFENAVDTLASALSTDIDWIREHTRLAGLAQRWDRAGRPTRLLLRGQDIADAEGWRDGHPKDAPAVTASQAAFVGESRRAATRRQRGWIGGSLGIAAAAVALAIFAYMQSVEAESQRAEADLQRIAAEQNAAEAERQRREVSRQLVAQSLRAGDFAGAAETMLEIDPDSRVTKTLLAGLATSDEGALRDRPGTPFTLNGLLHYSTADAPLKDDTTFPANAWTPVGDDLLLVTDSGRARRVTTTGKVLEDGPVLSRSISCGLHRGPDAVTLITYFSRGYNLSSYGVELLSVPVDGGAMRLDQPPTNTPFDVTLTGDEGPLVLDALKLARACSPFARTDPISGWDVIEPLRPLEIVSFPGPGPEAARWTGETDRQALAENQVARMDRTGVRSRGIERLRELTAQGLQNFPDYWANYADDLSHEDIVAFVILSDPAPQTGGTFRVCVGKIGGQIVCASFWSIEEVGVALSPDGTKIVAFGLTLQDMQEGSNGEVYRSNLWLLDAADGYYARYTAVDGEILSAAYAGDSTRLAVLTEGALTILNGPEPVQIRRPGEATAVTWAADGETLILFGEDGIAVGTPETGFSLTALTGPPGATSEYGTPRPLWLAQDADDGVLALGYGSEVVIYDLELAAPLTRPFEVTHPIIGGRVSSATLEVLEDGGFRLGIAGEIYERTGWNDGDLTDRLEQDSLYR